MERRVAAEAAGVEALVHPDEVERLSFERKAPFNDPRSVRHRRGSSGDSAVGLLAGPSFYAQACGWRSCRLVPLRFAVRPYRPIRASPSGFLPCQLLGSRLH